MNYITTFHIINLIFYRKLEIVNGGNAVQHETCGLFKALLQGVHEWYDDVMIRKHLPQYWPLMMTSSNGYIYRVTGPLWGESTGHRRIPLTRPVPRSFDVFFISAPEQTVEQTSEMPVIWDAIALIMRSLQCYEENPTADSPQKGSMMLICDHLINRESCYKSVGLPVIRVAITLMWRRCKMHAYALFPMFLLLVVFVQNVNTILLGQRQTSGYTVHQYMSTKIIC